MLFLYSYEYINNTKLDNINISNNQKCIIDKNNSTICGFSNIPHNKNYYNVSLSKTKKNNFYNVRIFVDINYNKIIKTIKNNKIIPNKTEFIRLLKRNTKDIDILEELYNSNSLIYINYFKQNQILSFYKYNILKLRDIFINTDTNKLSLSLPKNYKIKICVKGFIIIGLYNYKLINKFIYPNSNTLIITSKNSYNIINSLFESKALVILESEINSVKKKWHTIIVHELLTENINILSKFTYNKKIFIYRILTKDLVPKIYNLFLETNKINYNNTNNISYLKRITIFKKNTKSKINIEKLKLTNLEKNLYRCLNESYKNNFLSLPLIFTNFTNEIYNDKTCSICLNNIKNTNIVKTNCNHFYCLKCIAKNLKVSNKCPNCRQNLNYNLLSFTKNELENNAKIIYLENLLKTNIKILVISDFDITLKTIKKFINNPNCIFINLKEIDSKNFLNLIKSNEFKKIIFLDDTNINQNYYLNIIQSNTPYSTNFTLLTY